MEQIAHIIWPHSFLSSSEVINHDAYSQLVDLCHKGIYCSIYSGRSMQTLMYIKNEIAERAIQKRIDPKIIYPMIKVYSEAGSVQMDLETMLKNVTAPEFHGHKITSGYFQEYLDSCFLNPNEVNPVEKDMDQSKLPHNMNLVLDSIGNTYLIPINRRTIKPVKSFPDFILNPRKEYAKSAEGFRDLNRKIIPEIKKKIQRTASLAKELLCEWGLNKDIHVQPTGTSIDFYAILDPAKKIVCDMSYGLGKGIEALSEQLGLSTKDVLSRTVFVKPSYYQNDLIPVIDFAKNPENKINCVEVTEKNKNSFYDGLSLKPF